MAIEWEKCIRCGEFFISTLGGRCSCSRKPIRFAGKTKGFMRIEENISKSMREIATEERLAKASASSVSSRGWGRKPDAQNAEGGGRSATRFGRGKGE